MKLNKLRFRIEPSDHFVSFQIGGLERTHGEIRRPRLIHHAFADAMMHGVIMDIVHQMPEIPFISNRQAAKRRFEQAACALIANVEGIAISGFRADLIGQFDKKIFTNTNALETVSTFLY
ncbi:MAG: hypothetical protein IH598_17030 [Bacteroidales bacterium]|nr:hypothetical protein [Bacteroidales bacterium]